MSTSDAQTSDSQSKSTEKRRTWMFIGVAVTCLCVTAIVEWASHPGEIKEFGRVGEDFFPDFVDPTRATAMELYEFDSEKGRLREFSVKQLANGRWVIPSRHNYPADAEDKLAKTAASIIGIKRGAMVTRWEADHAQYGVVNPHQDKMAVGDVEGVGSRITLRGEDKAILADYIVGNKTEDEGEQRYVRHPEEDEVYIAEFNPEVSTKFSDWINTDLLELDGWDVREVTINDYSFDETQGQIQVAERDASVLSRKTSSDSWTMDGLEDETKEVNEDAMRDTVNTIADLKIVGVVPKQKGMTPDLKVDRTALKSQNDVARLRSDLLASGYILEAGQEPDSLKLLAREGELLAATEKGLHYRLYFGRAFAGTEEDLELGSFENSDKEAAKKDAADAKDEKKEEAKDSDPENSNPETAEDADESTKPGRYVFVYVEFDRKYLGDEPVKPTEPEQPAELNEAEAKKDPDAKEETDGEVPKDDTEDIDVTEDKKDENGAKEEPPAGEGEEDPLDKIRQDYEAAKQQYETDLKDYESKLEEYNKKIEDGKKKAEELNRRFAEWYYVIPGENFDKLKLTRLDLVKEKEKEEAADGEGAPDGAGMPGSGAKLPGGMELPGGIKLPGFTPPANVPSKEMTEETPKETPKAVPEESPNETTGESPETQPKEPPKAEPKELPKAEPKEPAKTPPIEPPKKEAGSDGE